MKSISEEEQNKEFNNIWSTHPFPNLKLYYENDLLPFRPKPFQDELFSSWIVRFARANFTTYSKLINQIVNEYQIFSKKGTEINYSNKDIDKNIPKKLIEYISKKSGIPSQKIEMLTIKKWKDRMPQKLIAGHKTKKAGGLRFCPLCLKSDKTPYFRRIWRIKFVTCCPVHKIILYDKCPNPSCNKPLRIHLIENEKSLKTCYFCGNDLTTAKIINLHPEDSYPEDLAELLKILKRDRWDTPIKEKYSSMQFFNAFYLIARLIRYYPFESETYNDHPFKITEVEEKAKLFLKNSDPELKTLEISHFVLKITYSYFEDYPNNLEQVISKYQALFNNFTQKDKCPDILLPFRNAKQFKQITSKRIQYAIEQLMRKNERITYDTVAKQAKCSPSFHLSYPHIKAVVDSVKNELAEPFYQSAKKVIEELKEEGNKLTLSYVAHKIGVIVEKIRRDKILNRLVYSQLKPFLRRIDIDKSEVLTILDDLSHRGIPITFKKVAEEIGLNPRTVRNKSYRYRKIIEPHLTSHTFTKKKLTEEEEAVENNTNSVIKSKLLNKNDVKGCVQELLQSDVKITMAKVASKLGVSHPTISKNLKFRKIVREAGNIKVLKKVTINPSSIKKTIDELKKNNEKITYGSVASLVGCNSWNIQQKPEIKKIVDAHHCNKDKPRYKFTIDQVKEAIEQIRKKGLKITQNEVCWQLKCNRSYFRINPDLKAIIMNAKQEDEKRIHTVIEPLEYHENLSPQAQQYEKTYLDFKEEMENAKKNWRLANNKILSKKLNIPLEILLEIKRKYLPYTRKINKIQAKKRLFNSNDNSLVPKQT